MPPKKTNASPQKPSSQASPDAVSDPRSNILLAMLKHASTFTFTTDWAAVAKEIGLESGKNPVGAAKKRYSRLLEKAGVEVKGVAQEGAKGKKRKVDTMEMNGEMDGGEMKEHDADEEE